MDSAREALRRATADDHARIDNLFASYRLDRRDDYAAFLQAQAAAFLPVEAAIDRADPTRIVPDWADRRRGAALCDDLRRLDAAVPAAEAVPAILDEVALLGAVYVLEGSRLGGRVLLRSVPDAFPRAFLSTGSSALWRTLIATLERNLIDPADRAKAAAAARDVFALFEAGALAGRESVL